MSTVIAKNVQIGTSGTATDNFTIFQPATPDGTLRIGNGNTGITTSQVALTSAGNVGIGTSSPGYKLEVNGSIASKVATTADATLGVQNSFASFFVLQQSDKVNMYTGAGQPIVFSTNGTERARIDSSGNVLVGRSTSDGYRLALLGNTQLTSSIQLTYSGVAASSIGLTSGGVMAFGVDFSTGATERARIDTNGNLMVGTTNATGNGVTLTGNGNGRIYIGRTNADAVMEFYYSGTRVGQINITSSSTSYITSSDYRLKEQVQPMTGALAKVALLKPCTYKWNADGSDGQGFIAHELAEVVPDCVVGEKDGVDAEGKPVYQGIDTSFLVATLTAAIQELKAIVDAQGAEIAALKAGQNVSGTP
jgi:hypothetical protein